MSNIWDSARNFHCVYLCKGARVCLYVGDNRVVLLRLVTLRHKQFCKNGNITQHKREKYMIARLVNDRRGMCSVHRDIYGKQNTVIPIRSFNLVTPYSSSFLKTKFFNNKNFIDKVYVQKNFMFFTSNKSCFQKISMTTILMISNCGLNILIIILTSYSIYGTCL